jgi:hypothetical protein
MQKTDIMLDYYVRSSGLLKPETGLRPKQASVP